MELLSAIEEQSSFGFTGKINFLSVDNKQYLGALFMKDGAVVHAEYEKRPPKESLFEIISNSSRGNYLSIVVEPEIVSLDKRTISISSHEFKSLFEDVVKRYTNAIKLRPYPSTQIRVNSEFLLAGRDVAPEEFKLLTVIAESVCAEEIYKRSPFSEHFTTDILLRLKFAKAIKVVV